MDDLVRKLLNYIRKLREEIIVRETIIAEKQRELQEFCTHDHVLKSEVFSGKKYKSRSVEYRCMMCQKKFTLNKEDPELEKKARG